MKKEHRKYLYIFTILFFVLGIVNILFSYLGFICMILPFVFLFKNKKKTWCQQYCPRSHFFNAVCPTKGFKTPKYFIDYTKWIMLAYFFFNMFRMIMSTIMVAKGNPPLLELRLFMFIPVPFDLPQIITFTGVPLWAMHFAYRIYSMMMSMTILGTLLGFIFKPRTWCSVCPISTMTGGILGQMKKSDVPKKSFETA